MESRWDSAMGCAVNFFRPFRPQENSLATLPGPPLAMLAPAQAVIGRAYGPELPSCGGGEPGQIDCGQQKKAALAGGLWRNCRVRLFAAAEQQGKSQQD